MTRTRRSHTPETFEDLLRTIVNWDEAAPRHPLSGDPIEITAESIRECTNYVIQQQEAERVRWMQLNEERRIRLEEAHRQLLEQRAAQEEMRRRELEERRKQELMTAIKNTFQLETGEKRDGTSASSRIFFVYVTPTGAELPITKCPNIKRIWGRSTGGFEGTTRQTVGEYEVLAPFTLKMVNLQTTFGRPRRIVNIFIDINPEHATIILQGLQEFGQFKGRAKVDTKRSTYRADREEFELTDTVLKEHFGLKILQPPTKKGAGSKVRSLIFD